MPRKRVVAIVLDLDWGYRRHIDVFDGIQRYAAEQPHWECVIDEYAHDRLGKRGLKETPAYDGIIARASRELAATARKSRVPLVNVWYNSPGQGLPSVFPDFVATGRMAAEHLLSRGFRRFGCLSSRRERAHSVQRQAFHETLAQAGFACNCATAPPQYSRHRLRWRAFLEMLDTWIDGWTPPLGVYVMFNDVTGRHVAETCRRRGLAIPQDVGLVAGLNETSVCLAPPPALTGIEVRYDRVGYESARMLDRLMRGKSAGKVPLLLPPVGVIARQSTDFFAVNDELVAQALRYISERSARDLSVDDVASKLHVGRRTLERRFQATLGRPIAGEMRRLRIEKARRELLESDLPIKAIAERCGFGDAKRMHEVFAREVGQSPTEFRASQARSHPPLSRPG